MRLFTRYGKISWLLYTTLFVNGRNITLWSGMAVNHAFTDAPRCQMALATLALKLSTTLGILQIPDLLTTRCMNLLDVSIWHKSRVMNLWDKSIRRSLSSFTWADVILFGLLWPLLLLSTLPEILLSKFPMSLEISSSNMCQCASGKFIKSIRIFVETSSRHSWWSTYQTHRTISNPLPPKLFKAVRFDMNRTASRQDICSRTLKQFFPTIAQFTWHT